MYSGDSCLDWIVKVIGIINNNVESVNCFVYMVDCCRGCVWERWCLEEIIIFEILKIWIWKFFGNV